MILLLAHLVLQVHNMQSLLVQLRIQDLLMFLDLLDINCAAECLGSCIDIFQKHMGLVVLVAEFTATYRRLANGRALEVPATPSSPNTRSRSPS